MGSTLKKTILIVDDAVVVRKALADNLSRDADLEVIGVASNGRLALAKLRTLRPDVILLDIEMPEMNGLETIPEIRKILPRVPIIMFSTLTERGAEATLDALALGATDYMTKPSNLDMGSTSDTITRDLIPKIKALCHLRPTIEIGSATSAKSFGPALGSQSRRAGRRSCVSAYKSGTTREFLQAVG